MAVIAAAITDQAKSVWAQMLMGDLTLQIPAYFKIGEGGWVGGTPVPRDPFAHVAENDVDAIANPGRYPAADGKYVFQKSFVSGDVVYTVPNKIVCTCTLAIGEANDDGFGNPPDFWEIGVFDSNDNMLAYGTFPIQVKSGPAITNTVTISI